MKFSNPKKWRKWFSLGRIIPALTIIGAGIFLILVMLGHYQTKPIENVIIAMLSLLAIDSLTERISILEKVESKISNISPTALLKQGSELLTIKEQGKHSSDIVLVGISLVSPIVSELGFFENKLNEGCNLKFLIVNPESDSLDTWSLMSRFNNIRLDAEVALKSLKTLKHKNNAKGDCEVRLSNVFLHFNLTAFDYRRDSGVLAIELYGYKGVKGERPHIILTKNDAPIWYQYFIDQFENLWNDSEPWDPKNSD